MRTFITPLLIVATVLLASAGLYLGYSAGGAGDTKGGALGDPMRALEIEEQAFGLVVLASLFTPAVALRVLPVSRAKRILVALTAGILAFIGLYVAGFQAEVSGVQACFPR